MGKTSLKGNIDSLTKRVLYTTYTLWRAACVFDFLIELTAEHLFLAARSTGKATVRIGIGV